ncbi:MAG: gas vesicle protein GvpN [Prochlorotrichaceae cyanobacterium]
MTTILQPRSRGFVSTPFIERLTLRAFRYLQSGFSVHLRGPAGTGKTTLALHLADLVARPIMLIFGDDEFKTSDLIGNQTGYTRKKVVDNFIHSVVKVEDEMRQNWVDSRLTMACREGFTLVYDEFNRSRPEVNNVLLSALEEKLLVLPPSANQRSDYVRVNPQFRGIFTSNPEEYCGVHATQDALMDRLITINVPEPDELTQQEILVQKTGIERESAIGVVRLVKLFRKIAQREKFSGLRSCLMIAKISSEHHIEVTPENPEFRDLCADILLSRTQLSLEESTETLWYCLNHLDDTEEVLAQSLKDRDPAIPPRNFSVLNGFKDSLKTNQAKSPETPAEMSSALQIVDGESSLVPAEEEDLSFLDTAQERAIYKYLKTSQGAYLAEIESTLRINRVQAVDALRSLTEKGILVVQRDEFTAKDPGRTIYRVDLSPEIHAGHL